MVFSLTSSMLNRVSKISVQLRTLLRLHNYTAYTGYRHRSSSHSHSMQSPDVKKKGFKIIDGAIDNQSKQFIENKCFNEELTKKYQSIVQLVSMGGGEKAAQRHVGKNKKILVNERLRRLFDDADDLLEIGALAGMGMKYGDVPKAGIVTVIGKINGVYCLAIANDATVKGGTVFPIGVKKQLRSQEIVQQNRLPTVYVVDSGGAFLPLQAEIFTAGGRTFYNEAIANSLNIPQLAVVCGSCTAGAAYVPTMAQEALIVDRIGTIFLGGPPLVYAALKERVSPEELGGGLMHSSVSGCTDHYEMNEEDAFETSREIVSTFNINAIEYTQDFEEPRFDASELLGIIPQSNQHTLNMYQVIARIVDGSRLQEFKQKFGSTLVTGFAHLCGHLAGIVANNGSMTTNAALKGAHFVQMCSQRNVPVIFLQNSEANLDSNGNNVDEGNRIKAHAALMASVACAEVPKLTVIVGNSFGADNFMMCGRAFNPRFIFSWPNAVTCISDPNLLLEQAIQQTSVASGDKDTDVENKLKEYVTVSSSAFNASGKLWDDGVILPQDTRKILGKCLEIVKQADCLSHRDVNIGVVRM